MFSTRSVHSNDIEEASFYMWNRSHVEGQVRPFNLFGILFDWASEMAKLYSCVCMIDKIHLSQLIRCAKIPNVKCQRMFTFHYKSEWKQNKHGAPLKRILFWFYNACAYLQLYNITIVLSRLWTEIENNQKWIPSVAIHLVGSLYPICEDSVFNKQ